MDILKYSYTCVTIVYVLKLENRCWYIGFTSNLNARLAEHFGLQGRYKCIKWLEKNKPIDIDKVYIGNTDDEDRITEEYMDRYGKEFVLGGKYCRKKKNHKYIKIYADLKKIKI